MKIVTALAGSRLGGKNLKLKILAVIIIVIIGDGTFVVAQEGFKVVSLVEGGLVFQINSNAKTVAEFLTEQKIDLKAEDAINPDREARIYSGSNIAIQRAKKITINADGNKLERHTLFKRVEEVLAENSVALNDVDIVSPARTKLVSDGTEIKITRVDIEEKTAKDSLDFKVITKEDNKLGWREEKIEQKGEKGIKEIKYRITYHNGKEIARETIESNIIKEPVAEIKIKGTYVKIGKAHKGQGTWYAWKGGLFAASPWLPMGSFAKVTNQENGKTVIVKINDRGPFGKGRIIDLDKVAFAKIASIGAGVIDVKVEEILN